jgi:hypothetical protein
MKYNLLAFGVFFLEKPEISTKATKIIDENIIG